MIETEALLNTIFSTSKIGICVTDHRNNLLNVNQTFCKIYGYSREELIGKPLSVLDPRDYKERANIFYNNFVRGNRYGDGEQEIQTKDGGNKTVFIASETLSNYDNQEYKLTTVIDISARGKVKPITETEVNSEADHGLASLLHNLPEGVFRINPKGELQFANKAFYELFGYVTKQDTFSFFTNLFYNKSARENDILELLEEGGFSGVELELKRKDGTSFWALVNCKKFSDEYANVYYDGTIRDISNQKNTTLKLEKQNNDLKKINGDLDRFVYSASHDLKAPLSSLLGLLGVLRQEKAEDQREKYLELMEKSIHKMDAFIMDIVDFSRNSSQKVRKERIDFEALVNEVFQELEYMDNAEKIKKIINVEQSVTFYADIRRVKILLSNLLSNAIRYSSTHRKDDCFIYVGIFVQPDMADIVVKDNGQGIAEKHLEHIFNMFYRASEGGGGSGLGLYIVKETVEKLNGKVQVVSELGKGTSFSIMLPAVTDEAKGAQMKLGI